MRRVVTVLLILGLAVPLVGVLAGCCSTGCGCEIKVPNKKYSKVVERNCYAVDRYGNPFPTRQP